MGLRTSVSASQMTDAYGASTLRVPHGDLCMVKMPYFLVDQMYNHYVYTTNGILMARNIKSDGKAPSMAEILLDPRSRKAQNQFLNQVDMMIDWRPIRTLINKKYTKKQSDAAGAPVYDVIVLFKMMLLQTWYGLSDCALEERINVSLSFSRFLGLPVETVSPDHSTLSRFRTALTKLG